MQRNATQRNGRRETKQNRFSRFRPSVSVHAPRDHRSIERNQLLFVANHRRECRHRNRCVPISDARTQSHPHRVHFSNKPSAEPKRMGEAGGLRRGRGHDRLLGHPGPVATPAAARVLRGNTDHPALQAQAETQDPREQRRKDRGGLPPRRAQGKRSAPVPRKPDARVCRAGPLRKGRLRPVAGQGRPVRPAGRIGLFLEGQDVDDDQVAVGGIPPPDAGGRGPAHRQEPGPAGGDRRWRFVARRKRGSPGPVRRRRGEGGREIRRRRVCPAETPGLFEPARPVGTRERPRGRPSGGEEEEEGGGLLRRGRVLDWSGGSIDWLEVAKHT
mmetsp:Transcript_22458/g.49822  ORF Transcript_22458/g.49822 Transcript_22458/m.49822 type:complete len:329 (-) Transcript_22458:2386-3372(-)